MSPLRWIRNLFTRDRMDRDLADEIELHLEEKVDALMAEGMTRPAAVAAARRAFGSVTLVREVSRDVWRWRALTISPATFATPSASFAGRRRLPRRRS